MSFCPHCSFPNDDKATVCQGPGCSERLPKKEPVCRIHRLPEGAKVCHICVTLAPRRPGPKPIHDDHGMERRKETSDLRIPRSAEFAPPKTPGNRITVDERLRRRDDEPVPFPARCDTHGMFPGAPINESPRRQTVNLLPGDTERSGDHGFNGKRIVGLLITFTWDPNGQIFPLHEGLSHLGATSQCEICVPEDDAMSSTHACIQYRKKFLINDLDSKNGTLVNDTPINEVYVRLENYARIQTGRTLWTFIMIDPMCDAEPAMKS